MLTPQGPLDPESVTQVLQVLAYRFPASSSSTYRFPLAAYHKIKTHTDQFSYDQLATILRCLTAMGYSVEDEVLEAVGRRMGQLLGSMDEQDRSAAYDALVQQ